MDKKTRTEHRNLHILYQGKCYYSNVNLEV